MAATLIAGCGPASTSGETMSEAAPADVAEADEWPLAAILVSEYRDEEGEVVNTDRTLIVGRAWDDWVTVELPAGEGELPRPGVGSQVVRWDGDVTSFAYLRERALDFDASRPETLVEALQELPGEVDWVDRRPLPEGADRQAPTGHFLTLWDEEAEEGHSVSLEDSALSEDETLSRALERLESDETTVSVVRIDGAEGVGLSATVALSEEGRLPLAAAFDAPGGHTERFWIERTLQVPVGSSLDAFDEALEDVEVSDPH